MSRRARVFTSFEVAALLRRHLEQADVEVMRRSWRRRAGVSPFSAAVTFNRDALVLGRGTILRLLPSDTPSGRISFDDCKQSDTSTNLPIPDLEAGDMFEVKAADWGWVLSDSGIQGYGQFQSQVKNQNDAVVAEGRGRQIYYCLGNQLAVSRAQNLLGADNRNSHFLVCR